MKHIKLYENFNKESFESPVDENLIIKNPGNGVVDGFSCKKLYALSEDQMYRVTKYLDDALTGKKKVTVEGKEYDILGVGVGGCPGGRYEAPCNSFTITINKPMPKNGIFVAQPNSTVSFLNTGKVLLETAIGAEDKLIPMNKSLKEIFNLGKKFFDRFKA